MPHHLNCRKQRMTLFHLEKNGWGQGKFKICIFMKLITLPASFPDREDSSPCTSRRETLKGQCDRCNSLSARRYTIFCHCIHIVCITKAEHVDSAIHTHWPTDVNSCTRVVTQYSPEETLRKYVRYYRITAKQPS